jgi:hypothetical protein
MRQKVNHCDHENPWREQCFYKHPPTAASLTDCFTAKQSLAGFELRLSAECSPGDIFVLKCSIIWLAHACISDTNPIISETHTQCQHFKLPEFLRICDSSQFTSLQLHYLKYILYTQHFRPWFYAHIQVTSCHTERYYFISFISLYSLHF